MHDTVKDTHWHEPKAGENAGTGTFSRPKLPYDRFMEAEGVPVYRGIGASAVQDLPMAPWKRLGGRGTYIQLYGTEGLWGMYVVEVPGAGALNVERHLYEKIVFVVEGRGSTEVWQEGETKRHVFEWQKGSLFTIPLNAFHRIVNAGSAPALLLCGTSAPNVMNLLDAPEFVFDCPHAFREALFGRGGLFQAQGRHRARSGARACHAADQFHSRHHRDRAAAGQSPLARLSPHGADDGGQPLLSIHRAI